MGIISNLLSVFKTKPVITHVKGEIHKEPSNLRVITTKPDKTLSFNEMGELILENAKTIHKRAIKNGTSTN